jgi:hypothetical protein
MIDRQEFEQFKTEIRGVVGQATDRLEWMQIENERLRRHRATLIEAVIKLVETCRAHGDRSIAVIEAARMLEDIEEEISDEGVLISQIKRDADRWIDALGTAPPGVDLDDL